MIILGDISGIQNYLFDVAEEGGGQAQRLRARSFFVQLLGETAALHVLRALGWAFDSTHFLLSGAGKFMLRGPAASNINNCLAAEQHTFNEWFLRETNAELRITLAWCDSAESDVLAYDLAQQRLQQAKAQPWALLQNESWDVSRLVLAPLDTPCSLCRHARSENEETDPDSGQIRRICRTCADNKRLGQRLPTARWLVIREKPETTDLKLFGFGIAVVNEGHIPVGPDTIALANLREPDQCPSWCPEQRFLRRRLMAHVPADGRGQPIWFTELVQRAKGDRLLGVLKADADSLGVRFHRLLSSDGLEAMTRFSARLDGFFAGKLKQEITNGRDPRWQSIYTIFAGGDDLVMVGPWDVMLDFVGYLREIFTSEFRDHGLTLSAGLALIKPKRPIKTAVAESEELLEKAKSEVVADETTAKDQFAAFGQLWKWKHHATILDSAKKLVGWVKTGQMERGWLHTLLELSEQRHGVKPNLLATSRLSYHVDRNYRTGSDARRWADTLITRFDDPSHVEVRYLPAIVRYALVATRTPGEEN